MPTASKLDEYPHQTKDLALYFNFFDKINIEIDGAASMLFSSMLMRRYLDKWDKIGLTLMLNEIGDTRLFLELLAMLTKQK